MFQKVTQERNRLARILYEKSYLAGEFTLTSGKKSNYYFDCRQSSLNPEGASLIGSIFFSMLDGMNADAVAGMTMGADPLVTATSIIAFSRGKSIPALIIRKEPKGHGTARSVEGLGNVCSGQNVIMLEDVISTGGSVLKACSKVEDAGLNIIGIFSILDREEGGADIIAAAGYKLQSIFTKKEFLALATAS